MFPAGSEAEIETQARVDLAKYVAAMMRDDDNRCAAIEIKYGLYGLSPQQVAEELSEIAAVLEPQV